jgi:hypothetical protein
MPEDEQMVKVNQDFLVTETTIDPKLPVAEVVTWLVQKKTTGQLNFSLSQGSIQKVALVERTKAPSGVREKLRKLLGV